MPSPIALAFAALQRGAPDAAIAWTPAGCRTRAELGRRADALMALCEGAIPDGVGGRRVALGVRDPWDFLAAFLALRRLDAEAVLLDAADPQAPRRDLATRFGAMALLHDVGGLVVEPMGGDAAAGGAAIKLTSGSTGAPRGIAVSDEQLLADAAALECTMGIGERDRVLAAVPMSFSYGVGNLLVPALAFGRHLVLPDPCHPLGLLRAMQAGGPTVLPAVPALLRALLQGRFVPPPSLRLWLCAGGVLTPELAQRCRQAFGRPVHVFYGATEAGGISYDRSGDAAERGTVGTPVHGVEVTITPTGQVAVRSPAVGTAIDGTNPADGCFVAPDFGVLDAGELRLLGRAGDVFDVGGHKVDPREIERLLVALPGVQDAAVVRHLEADGRAIAVALIAGVGVDEATLRRHCLARLPAAKVPRRLLVLPTLPRCGRGKLQAAQVTRLLAEHPNDVGEART